MDEVTGKNVLCFSYPRDIVRGSRHLYLHGEMGEKGVDVWGAHVRRVALMMEEHTTLSPVHICLFHADTHVCEASGMPHLIESFRSSVAERYHSFTQAVAVECGCSHLVGATRCNTSYHPCKRTCKPLMTCDKGAGPMASRVHAVAAMRASRANGATTDASASTGCTARRAWASRVPGARTGPGRSSRQGSGGPSQGIRMKLSQEVLPGGSKIAGSRRC